MSIEDKVERMRELWAQVAKDNGWYKEPFYVQVWVDPDTNEIYDSVSYTLLEEDVVIYEKEDYEDD
jgi:hypothetical protein